MKKSFSLHPKTLKDPLQAKELHDFFNQEPKERKVWQANTAYTFGDDEIIFDKTIIKRERRNRKNTTGSRYEVLALEPFNKGTYGDVYTIEMNFGLSAEGSLELPKQQKRRVAKFFNFKTKEFNFDSLINEHACAEMAEHIHVKPLVLIKDHSQDPVDAAVMVMREIPGESLKVVLDELNQNLSPKLSIEQLFELSIALIEAYIEQVKNKGLLHKDIKPENLKIEFGPPIRVYFLDYGFSCPLQQLNHEPLGSALYMAPEQLCSKAHKNSDIYSLGMVLLEFWVNQELPIPPRVLEAEDDKAKAQALYDEKRKGWNLIGLFYNIPEAKLNQYQRKMIKGTLGAMLDPNPDNRLNIEQALRNFKILKREYNPDDQFSSSSSSPQRMSGSSWASNQYPTKKSLTQAIEEELRKINEALNQLAIIASQEKRPQLETLVGDLREKTQKLAEIHPKDEPQTFRSCLEDIHDILTVNSNLFKTYTYSEEATIIKKNIGLAIASLFLIYLIAIGINKLLTGNLRFFKPRPQLETITESIQHSLNQIETISMAP